jgi:hypothetical protein
MKKPKVGELWLVKSGNVQGLAEVHFEDKDHYDVWPQDSTFEPISDSMKTYYRQQEFRPCDHYPLFKTTKRRNVFVKKIANFR